MYHHEHTYTHRAALSLWDVEVLAVKFGAFCLGAEGDATAALTQPTGIHAVHLALQVLLAIVGTLRGDCTKQQGEEKKKCLGAQKVSVTMASVTAHVGP